MTALDLSALDLFLVALAAVAGGLVNAVAGGGTLITFPILTAVGLPAVAANVTNTVALCPGYLGGTFAQSADLRGQGRRLWLLLPAGVIGGILGGILLLNTGERIFRELVPYLILMASGLLAAQPYLRNWLVNYQKQAGHKSTGESWSVAPVTLAAIYGGYFGAGLGVITLAVLGLVLEDTLTRLNALKQALSLAINVAAALFFVFSDQVVWPVAAVMAVGALGGGALGGRLAGRLNPTVLRWLVVTVGVGVAIVYLVR